MVQKSIRLAAREAIMKKVALAEAKAAIKTAPLLKKLILESIGRGVSPVEGFGRFDQYSIAYKNAIRGGYYEQYKKRQRPVNLKLSGKMLKKLSVKASGTKLVVKIDSKIADYHNKEGAGKSKIIRRLLPGRKEEFSRQITSKVLREFKRIFNKMR